MKKTLSNIIRYIGRIGQTSGRLEHLILVNGKLYILIYIYTYIYIYILYNLKIEYIYIYISYSAASTDILDPLSSLLPIIHRLWQVFGTTSRILTSLLYVCSRWSS